jgi:predicted PurR-regulated permease PerM
VVDSARGAKQEARQRSAPPPPDDSPRALIRYAIVMVVLTGLLLCAAYIARGVLLLIYVSALFAIGFSPLVRLIQKQRRLPIPTQRRWAAILVIYLLILGTIAGIGAMLIPPLVDQARALSREAPAMFAQAQQWLVEQGLITDRITLQEAMAQAPAGTDAVTTVVGAITGVIGGIFGFITILILTFYFLIDAGSLFQGVLRMVPRGRRAQIDAASREVTVKVSAWLLGQLLLGAIIGVTAAIGLGLLGIPYFYVLALIAGIGEMIPVVGPILAAFPAVAVAFTISGQKALLVALFFLAQQQLENHVLVPKIMERQVGMSAVTVIVALLIGGSLLGIVGAILAVPTAAILQVVLQELTRE